MTTATRRAICAAKERNPIVSFCEFTSCENAREPSTNWGFIEPMRSASQKPSKTGRKMHSPGLSALSRAPFHIRVKMLARACRTCKSVEIGRIWHFYGVSDDRVCAILLEKCEATPDLNVRHGMEPYRRMNAANTLDFAGRGPV